MNRTAVGCLVSALGLALLVSIGVNFAQFTLLLGMEGSALEGGQEKLQEKLAQPGEKGVSGKIVHLDLEGIISNNEAAGLMSAAVAGPDFIKRGLEQALKDEQVKAVVLRVNSPGGEVTASDTIYAAVKKAAEKKPIIVYMDSVAASGGYYVACGATKVVASETTLTGSIGVIMESMSYHDLFEKVGLGTRTFTSGAFKDTLSGARPMREEERVYVQGLVDEMYERFLGIVSAARSLPKQQLKAGPADGRVLTGRQAKEAGLVDQIGYIEDAYNLARELGQTAGAKVVRYHSSPSLLSALGLASMRGSEPVKVQLDLGGALPQLQPGLMYFLPAWPRR